MAKQVKLTAQRREATGRSAIRKLKARGIVPAIVYGGKDKPQPLQVSRRDISLMLSHASGENILVELEITGEKGSRMAMIQEIQHSPVGGNVLHIDFHAVSMDEKIEADVPLEPVGVANGVKNFGGLLEQSLRAERVREDAGKITQDGQCLRGGVSRLDRLALLETSGGERAYVYGCAVSVQQQFRHYQSDCRRNLEAHSGEAGARALRRVPDHGAARAARGRWPAPGT